MYDKRKIRVLAMEAARTLWGLSGGETVCVNAAEEELQRLKPLGFQAVYVVAKAATHKDSRVLTRTVKPRPTKITRWAKQTIKPCSEMHCEITGVGH